MSKSTIISLFTTLLLTQSLALQANADDFESEQPIQAVIILDKPTENFESSPSSPPLATDDTGTPGKKGIEINFISNCDRSTGSRACEMITDSNFGIGEKVQLKIAKAAVHETSVDGPEFRGVGPTEVGVKYRFYDRNGTSMAIYPTYIMNDASKRIDNEGQEINSEGRSVYLPLIISKQMGKYTTIANIGYTHAMDNHDNSSFTTAVAVGRAINDTNRVMAEIHSERNLDSSNRRTDVRLGWVKVIYPNKSAKYQLSIFTSIGPSEGRTEDGVPHTTVQFGISVVKK